MRQEEIPKITEQLEHLDGRVPYSSVTKHVIQYQVGESVYTSTLRHLDMQLSSPVKHSQKEPMDEDLNPESYKKYIRLRQRQRPGHP